MAISTYAELKTAIGKWDFDSGSTINADDMVTLAQGYINRTLRHWKMLTQTDISVSSGLFALPNDFLAPRLVVEKASIRRILKFIAMEEADEVYPDRPSGLGQFYTMIGGNLRVYPTISNDIELTYYAALAAMSNDGDSDWLLARFPNLYLSASLMFAADYLKDDQEAAKQKAVTDSFIDMLNSEGELGEFANASYHIEGMTP